MCDRLIAHYRTSMRTCKWPVRVFNHFVDLVVVNCWLMYKRACKSENMKRKDIIGLLAFRIRVAESMIRYEGGNPAEIISPPQPARGRLRLPTPLRDSASDEDDPAVPPPKKHCKVIRQPIPEVRLDEVGHLPRYQDDKFASKCRFPGCKSWSRTKCTKCDVYLCILKNNCFEKYHTAQ